MNVAAAAPTAVRIDPDTYRAVRARSMALAAPLGAEDACVQSMPDASPAKWHLAHTSWFFETVVLEALDPSYRSPFDGFRMLFNSYYNGIGPQFARAARGLLTRPGLDEIRSYRGWVDERLEALLAAGCPPGITALVELGLHHEQQHQELLLMDVKHLFSCNPLRPAYATAAPAPPTGTPAPLAWHTHAGGLAEYGAPAAGFAFDNERPRHRHFLAPFSLASRPVTNAEYAAFIADGGYETPSLWLADGWARIRADGWEAPLYWRRRPDGGWSEFTLAGELELAPATPVCHVSHYEADAYARWAGARLPTEYEWERAAAGAGAVQGNLLETGLLHPAPAPAAAASPVQMFGDVWEWTTSAYAPYPGFRPLAGAVGEYNGKFMSSQLVLRGGCCATPASHLRATYRNFFYPYQRWQFGGIRLAKDA